MVQILLLPQARELTDLHHYLVPHQHYMVMEAHHDYGGDLGSLVAGRPCPLGTILRLVIPGMHRCRFGGKGDEICRAYAVITWTGWQMIHVGPFIAVHRSAGWRRRASCARIWWGLYTRFDRHHRMDFPSRLSPVVSIQRIIRIDLPGFLVVIRIVEEPAREFDPAAQQLRA
jgi:hypothetical protein